MTKRNQVRKDITLWSDDVQWFENTYRGLPLSNALARMLSEFRKLHGTGTPQVYIEQAARFLKDNLEERSGTVRGNQNESG